MSTLLKTSCLALTLIYSAELLAEDTIEPRYRVDFAQAAQHYVSVEAVFPRQSEDLQLFLPVWTPGSYLVREYAQHIDGVQAFDEKSEPLKTTKLRKNRWQVHGSANKQVRFKYRVYCNELSVRTNFVDSSLAVLNGAATFVSTEALTGGEHHVELLLPSQWKQAATALATRVDKGPRVYVAEDFDQLIDSPIVAGNVELFPFQVGDVTHYLVNVGGSEMWDGNQAASDVSKIVAEHQRMWGLVPYSQYHFLNVIAESGGGLEHDNSTLMLSSRWSFRDKRRYQRWLGLVSHEFFHTWNIRRLRPRSLAEYDYENENYFEELWVAEGVTSYYDDLALVRSGVTTPQEYLSALSRQIGSLQSTEGRLRQSLADSSYDAWIKYYRTNENSRNTTISYYTKGAVVAFLLDMEIRQRTGGKKSLDDLMRSLYKKFAGKQGYTNADVLAEANALAGDDLSEWFEHAIYSTKELEYERAMAWLGLRLGDQPDPTAKENSDKAKAGVEASKAESPAKREENEKKPANEKSAAGANGGVETRTADSKQPSKPTGPLWTGISTKTEDGRTVVASVAEGSPGFRAGVNVDDELIALNAYRIGDSLTSRLEPFKDDANAKLLISRRGKLLEIELPIERRSSTSWTIKRLAKPSEEQAANFRAWLRIAEESKEPKPAPVLEDEPSK